MKEQIDEVKKFQEQYQSQTRNNFKKNKSKNFDVTCRKKAINIIKKLKAIGINEWEDHYNKMIRAFDQVAQDAKAVSEDRSVFNKLNYFIFGNRYEKDMDELLKVTEEFADKISKSVDDLQMTFLKKPPKENKIPKVSIKSPKNNFLKNSQKFSVPYSIEKE